MLKPGSNVFVTGATGLIGGELVRTLLTYPVGQVWALVRPTRAADPTTRLAERFQRTHGEAAAALEGRVRAVAGDVGAEHLGLSPGDYDELRDQVDIIVHSAAETSFIRSMACRRTNIAGAKCLIDFAQSCRRRPLLVYLSTAYVSGVTVNACVGEEEGCQPDNDHHNEYTRSKAVAEELVRSSGLPVLVVRPSIVLSAGLSDPVLARAILWFVPLLNQFDAVPVNPVARPDVVPVQFVVDSVLQLLQVARRRYDTYHISAGEDGAVRFQRLGEVFDQFYHRHTPMRLIAPPHWTRDVHRQYIRTANQRKIFASMRKYLPFLNMNVVFDNSRLRQELGSRYPTFMPLDAYLGEMLSFIPTEQAVERWLSAGQAPQLADKVAPAPRDQRIGT